MDLHILSCTDIEHPSSSEMYLHLQGKLDDWLMIDEAAFEHWLRSISPSCELVELSYNELDKPTITGDIPHKTIFVHFQMDDPANDYGLLLSKFQQKGVHFDPEMAIPGLEQTTEIKPAKVQDKKSKWTSQPTKPGGFGSKNDEG